MASLEASPHYIIYFDNVRVDEFVKSWTVNLSCNGNIGTAEIEFVYLAELAYTAASVKDIHNSESIMRMLGVIDNMTNVKIFVKNIFSQKYQLIFDGNIKGKSSSRSPRGSSLVFRAVDYMAWTNRTIAPIVIPYTQSTHPSDKFIWEAQGIDVSKVMDVAQRDIIGFKGKRLEEIVNTVVTQALAANKIYSSKQGVAYWDGIWDRMDLMADIDPDILNKNVLDYIISPNQGNVDTMYVLLNDIFAKLMFEFYQDRDGIIRIKPPYWNEPVLKSHIIDPVLILNQSETSDYDKYVSRVVITGGLDENFQTAGDYASKLWTPTGAYLSDGTWETVQKSDKWVNGWLNTGESGGEGGVTGSFNAAGGINSRTMTKNGFRFIKGQEGYAPYGCYFNNEKFRTVGYGSTERYNKAYYDKHKPFPCSEKLASEIYAERVQNEFGATILKAMDSAGISDKIKDHQFDAMIAGAYNRGVYGFLNDSTSPWRLIKKNPNNTTGIAAAWRKWATTSQGVVLSSLVERRKLEADMYANGNYYMQSILRYNSSGKADGKVTENNGNGYIPSFLKGSLGATRSGDIVTQSSNASSVVQVEFDMNVTKKGNVYRRKDGSPIVGVGNSAQYKDIKGSGIWWPSVELGVQGHVQHLSSYFRNHLISTNKCVDPVFGENKRTIPNVKGMDGTWSSSPRYGSSIIFIINKMLGCNLKDMEIGAYSKAQYDERVTPEKKKKIKDYFIKSTQGKTINLSSSTTKEALIDRYFKECESELIYPEVAIAQMCQETGHLSFKGSVVYQQNNFAGIGVNVAKNSIASDWYWINSVPRALVHSPNQDAVAAVEYIGLQDNSEFSESEEIAPVSNIMSRTTIKPKYVIVDAGHGGDDEGAVGGNSADKYLLKEKDVALWLQNRVIDILRFNKINAYHSRTNDRDIGSGADYKKRTNKILSDIKSRGHNPSDYLIVSIHAHAASSSSTRGYSTMIHSSEAGANSKNLEKRVKEGMHLYAWHHWATSGCSKPERPSKTSTLSSLSEKNFPGGTVLIDTICISSLEDRKLWLNNKFTFRDACAVGIATGIVSYLGKNLNGTPSLDIEDTNNSRVDEDSTATEMTHPNSNLWNGSSFKEDLDWNDVDFSELLKPTHDEMRYGGSIAQIEQPLIKFSNAGAYYDMQGEHNADANEVLKAYAKFYMNMNNSLINTSSITMIGAPWIRPGFNVWVDPAYTDKVYYVNNITHSGSSDAGVTTTLQLVHGRHRADFLKDGDARGFGALSKNDDSIFTKNEYFKSVKHFGPVLESSKAYNTERTNLINIMNNCNKEGIIKAERSPYAAYYASDYGDSFIKTPTILKVNDAGKQIFTDDEWKEITGRSKVVDTSAKSGSSSSGKTAKSETSNTTNKQSRMVVGTEFENTPRTIASKTASERAKRTFTNNAVLKKGKRGAKIKELQGYMNEFIDRKIIVGQSKLAIDGIFGPLTDGVVKAYQKAKGIAVDGMVGPITTAKINGDLNSSPSSGSSNTGSLNPGVTNTESTNSNPKNETANAKGRLSSLLFTDQYTAAQIKTSLDGVYKNYAPGVVKQRMHIIEKGIIAARKTSEAMYLNNNYNK